MMTMSDLSKGTTVLLQGNGEGKVGWVHLALKIKFSLLLDVRKTVATLIHKCSCLD